MSTELRNVVRRNPEHFARARVAAALSIRQDGRLLGIPSVRDGLINAAALAALGCQDVLNERNFRVSHEENRAPMQDALHQAVLAAESVLSEMPPLRPARPKKAVS